MSEASTTAEAVIDATVDNAVEVAAPVTASAPESVKTAVKDVATAVKKSAAVALATPAPKAAAKRTPARKAKRASKPRSKPVAAVAVAKPSKAARKAAAPTPRRKYVRKAIAAAKSVPAPSIKGPKTMTYETPNWFAGFTAVPSADKFQTLFADAGAKSQDVVRKSQAFAEQVTDAAKANVEAVVESTRIATAGARDLGQEVVASTRNGLEQASTAVKSLAEAKSPTEFFQLQSELARSSFDRFVSEGSKFTEQVVKLAGEAIQPLSNRASVSAEKFSELTA